jgi:hypothetical protein
VQRTFVVAGHEFKTIMNDRLKENVFSICFGLTGRRGARFSPAVDVITFSGVIHLATDQTSSLEAFKINNRRSRLAA